jgi:hypothetical protein
MSFWQGFGPEPAPLGFRQEAFTLGALASQFPRTADGFSFLARFPFGRLLEMVAALHLPEETFALHLLLERFQRLIDVVIADHDLNYLKLSIGFPAGPGVSLERQKRRNGRKRSLSGDALARPTGDCDRPSCLEHDGQARVRYHRKTALPTAYPRVVWARFGAG